MDHQLSTSHDDLYGLTMSDTTNLPPPPTGVLSSVPRAVDKLIVAVAVVALTWTMVLLAAGF